MSASVGEPIIQIDGRSYTFPQLVARIRELSPECGPDAKVGTYTNVTYWVYEDSPYGKFGWLVSEGEAAAISYRDKFRPKGRVEKHTAVITSATEIISAPKEVSA
ncbi:hypothetical protein M1M07_23850 [Rhodococcus sp. HM1]|uniref:hypothetical protein n=1 Tax=Rhodococcus sp. HM1 TaxID=2937759 RepID=UPI00200B117B|nr:hypothetical protein [Rhodococcus sp. HM1]MCK8674132.1 hypothetical protein [Rhodococcus sp. HM1]